MLNSCLFVRFNLLPRVAAVDALRINTNLKIRKDLPDDQHHQTFAPRSSQGLNPRSEACFCSPQTRAPSRQHNHVNAPCQHKLNMSELNTDYHASLMLHHC